MRRSGDSSIFSKLKYFFLLIDLSLLVFSFYLLYTGIEGGKTFDAGLRIGLGLFTLKIASDNLARSIGEILVGKDNA